MSRDRDREMRKIFNDSDKEHVEKFQHREIRIPARGHIIMTRSECTAFLGQYRYYDKERSSGEKPLRWEVHKASDPTVEEQKEAANASAEMNVGARSIPIKEAERILDAKVV